MKVLITGNLGFIGSNLQPILKERGHDTFGFDAAEPSSVDIRDFKKCKEVVEKLWGKPEIIVHLAGQTSSKLAEEKPAEDFTINTVGTLSALEMARMWDAKLIYPSTQKVKPSEQGARSPYGMSKYVAELLCYEWNASYGVPVIVNRFGNLYGVGTHKSGDQFWVNVMIQKAVQGEQIEVWGDGSAARDMLHITDLIDLLVDEVENFNKYAAEQPFQTPIEAGGGPENVLSIKQLLTALRYSNVTYTDALVGDKDLLVTDNTFVTRINGWYPQVTLEKGIDGTKRYYTKLKTDA